jgi:hypothetical protein
VPTDLAVSLESVTAIPVQSREMAVLHMDLNLSAQVYQEFVRPLLQTPFGGFTPEADPPPAAEAGGPLQFSRVFTGHVDRGASQVVTIPLDPGLTVASFALYDTTRSLAVAVTGASGKTIDLSARTNGLIVVDDPSALFYLGYGFENPKPGLWRVELRSSEQTPAQGADYALAARFAGGAELVASLSSLLPITGDTVSLTGGLRLRDRPGSVALGVVPTPDKLQVLDWPSAAAGEWRVRSGDARPVRDRSERGRHGGGLHARRAHFVPGFRGAAGEQQLTRVGWLDWRRHRGDCPPGGDLRCVCPQTAAGQGELAPRTWETARLLPRPRAVRELGPPGSWLRPNGGLAAAGCALSDSGATSPPPTSPGGRTRVGHAPSPSIRA